MSGFHYPLSDAARCETLARQLLGANAAEPMVDEFAEWLEGMANAWLYEDREAALRLANTLARPEGSLFCVSKGQANG